MMSLISSQTYMTDFIMWSPKEEILNKFVAKSLVLDAICFFSTTTIHMSSFPQAAGLKYKLPLIFGVFFFCCCPFWILKVHYELYRKL